MDLKEIHLKHKNGPVITQTIRLDYGTTDATQEA
jgi:hypothetical protein